MRLALTGLGLLSPFGSGRVAFADAWAAGRVGIGDLTLVPPEGPTEHAAEIAGYDWRSALLSKQTFADRLTQLTVGAVRLALEDAGLPVPVPDSEEFAPGVGLGLGTRFGCVGAAEKFYAPVAEGKGKTASALVFSHSYPNAAASLAAIEFGLRGYGVVQAGSRESGVRSVLDAAYALAAGGPAAPNRIVAGAADALSAPVIGHFAATGDGPDTQGREPPASAEGADPDTAAFWGRVPGEGAVFAVLETEEAARMRGAPPRWTGTADDLRAALAASAPSWRLGDAGAVTSLYGWAARLLGCFT